MRRWLENLKLRARWSAFKTQAAAWGGRTWRTIGAAPWRMIGLWAGGAFAFMVTALVLLLTFADWNALKGPISRFASNASGREIVIRGDLDVNPWSWTPQVRVSGLSIGNPPRYRERGAFAEVAQADVALRLLPLLAGRLDIVRLDLNGAEIALYRNAEGVSNWQSDARARGRPINLPAIRRFSLNEGRVRFEDQRRNMVLDAAFTTEEGADPDNAGQFVLNGEGRINNRPFQVALTGAPLLNVRRDRPYAFNADVRAGPTRIRAEGAIARPFDLNRWQADIIASGADLAELYTLIGLALPNTPPYQLRGRVERRASSYAMPRVAGRIGDSDITGAFTASRHEGRLFLDGAFTSRTLDFDDLLAVLGGAPDTDETASPDQRAIAARMEAQGRILPDARLDISRVRNMDARVSYRADNVRDAPVPLRSAAVDVHLERGLLRLEPLTLQLARGRLGGAVSINAREQAPQVALDMRLRDARMEDIFRVGERPALSGVLVGRARLTGAGASVRQAAANANGEVTFVAPSGQVREAFAELTGINITRGLGLLLTGDQGMIGLRCGVASFQVTGGVAQVRSMVFDTETMLIQGSGAISLRTERLDLEIEGRPKEPRLIRVAAPISIEGPLRAPQVGIQAEDALDQGGLAALLATVAAPLAAILPFVDAGLAEDANCAALLAGRNAPARAG